MMRTWTRSCRARFKIPFGTQLDEPMGGEDATVAVVIVLDVETSSHQRLLFGTLVLCRTAMM